ncbi:MAG: dockerin type I domain-containing protein [Patescibacteria group bacterium]|nr:dockerin type I domain-containing protein [Patescibacteria group bacterium]
MPSPSDVNRDGCVGIQDFNIWQQAFSTQTVQSSTYPDINKDGAIDILDFNVWYQAMKSGVSLCQ